MDLKEPAGKKRKILIVEDSMTQAMLLKQFLENLNYTVSSAANGLQAIEFITNQKNELPELIISDIIMPEMDGLEFCRLAKKIHPDIFIIMLTANTDDQSLKESFDAGAIDFINKPINETELFVRLKNILRIKKAEIELKSALLKLSESNRKLKELSVTDPLTGVFNRRYLIKKLNEQISYTRRYKNKLSVIMIDIDHFKNVNDTYGHNAGDEILKKFAEIFTRHLRDSDIFGRYGGEEFLVILPSTTKDNTRILSEKISNLIKDYKFSFAPDLQVTFSAGVVELKSEQTDDLLAKADKFMYLAKKNGRNRIESE